MPCPPPDGPARAPCSAHTGVPFPGKNTLLSAATGSGACKEPAKSRFAIPCRIASAVKRSGRSAVAVSSGICAFLRQPKDMRPGFIRSCLLLHNRTFRPCESRSAPALFVTERGIYGTPVEYDLLLQTSGSIWPCAPAVATPASKQPDTLRCADVPTAIPQ